MLALYMCLSVPCQKCNHLSHQLQSGQHASISITAIACSADCVGAALTSALTLTLTLTLTFFSKSLTLEPPSAAKMTGTFAPGNSLCTQRRLVVRILATVSSTTPDATPTAIPRLLRRTCGRLKPSPSEAASTAVSKSLTLEPPSAAPARLGVCQRERRHYGELSDTNSLNQEGGRTTARTCCDPGGRCWG